VCATFGVRSVESNSQQKRLPLLIQAETPYDMRSGSLTSDLKSSMGNPSSLFDELETIFQKNRKWLDEQREREEFLKEMASHYNQRLSQEMNSLRKS
jgi:hypothetical protein